MRVFCFFVFCSWSDQTDFMALFMVLIGGVFHALFLNLVVFLALFLLLPTQSDIYQMMY